MAQEQQREELLIRDRVTGQPRPYYVDAKNINLGDDETYKSLPDVLGEMQDDIDDVKEHDGGYTPPQGGIPKTDLAQSVQDTLDDVANKVDKVTGKGLSTNDYTTAEKSKLGNLPTADQLTQQLGGKANDNAVIKSISVNGGTAQTPTNGNVNIVVPSGGLTESDISVETQGDGTVDINVGSGTYTINLNHTHENMAKLIVCEESDLPSTLDNSTIYAITDSGETEIEKLIIRGMEFVGGGGTPSADPRILSPVGTQIDFNGNSTKTVTVRAVNLSEALTIAVTGMTASLQTISANDAENGVQLTLTKGQNFNTGTLRIYSSEVDKSWNVGDSQDYQLLTAIKLTGTQWLKTDYVPKTTTEFEMLVKFGDRNTNNTYGPVLTTNVKPAESSDPYIFRMNTDVSAQYGMGLYFGNAKSQSTSYGLQGFQNLTEQQMLSDNTLISYALGADTNNNPCGIFRFGSLTCFTTLQASDMDSPIMIGYGRVTNSGSDNILNRYSLTIYRFTITEGGTTVRNYVPAMHIGVPGLYDTVTGAFISSETSTQVVAIE